MPDKMLKHGRISREAYVRPNHRCIGVGQVVCPSNPRRKIESVLHAAMKWAGSWHYYFVIGAAMREQRSADDARGSGLEVHIQMTTNAALLGEHLLTLDVRAGGASSAYIRSAYILLTYGGPRPLGVGSPHRTQPRRSPV